MIDIYDFPRSSASFRVRIACALKGVDYNKIPINFRENAQRSAEYLKIGPQGLVPTLVTEDGFTLSQSLAILMWLDTHYPKPRLVPEYEADALRAWEMALMIACDIHPLNNLRVLKYLERSLGADEDARNAWYSEWVGLGFEGLEARVSQYGGQYCLGDQLTVADVCLVPQMMNARRFHCDLTRFPKLVEIDARLNLIAEFAAAAPQ